MYYLLLGQGARHRLPKNTKINIGGRVVGYS